MLPPPGRFPDFPWSCQFAFLPLCTLSTWVKAQTLVSGFPNQISFWLHPISVKIFRLGWGSESARELCNIQIPSPHSPKFWFGKSNRGPRHSCFLKKSTDGSEPQWWAMVWRAGGTLDKPARKSISVLGTQWTHSSLWAMPLGSEGGMTESPSGHFQSNLLLSWWHFLAGGSISSPKLCHLLRQYQEKGKGALFQI